MASPEGGSQAARVKQALKPLTQQAWVKRPGEQDNNELDGKGFGIAPSS